MTDNIKSLTGIRISPVVLVILGFLILWAALGVGELYDKTGLMFPDPHRQDMQDKFPQTSGQIPFECYCIPEG